MSASRTGALLVLGGTALFGTIGTARVLGFADAPTAAVACVRMLLASSLMVAFAVATRSRRPATPVGSLLGIPALWVAAVGQACFQVSFLAAVTRVGVATGTLVAIGATPLLTGIGATLRTRRPTRAWVVSTVVGIVGLALLVGTGNPGSTAGGSTLGLVLAFAASAFFACYILGISVLAEREHAVGTTLPVVFALVAVVLSPALLLSDWGWLASWDAVAMVGWLATAPTVVAYALFNRGLALVEAPVAATLGLVEPVVATSLAVLLLGETLSATESVGGLLVAVAVLATARLPAPAPSPRR